MRHVSLLGERRDKLTRQKVGAEERYLAAVAQAYDGGIIGMAELAEAYYDYREIADPGYSRRWDKAIPVSAAKVAAYAKSRPRREPNSPDGSWLGPYPFDDGPTPGIGTAVAYLLFDQSSVICYIGSTASFRSRLNRHVKDGKSFIRWEAYPCQDRGAAFDLEYRLIGIHQPYLNSAGRL